MSAFVRLATPDDLELLEYIENTADSALVELFEPEEWAPAASASERTGGPGFILVAAESIDGPAIGFVDVIESGSVAHLEQVSVLPSHGRRGHGRMLVEAAKREARDRGYGEITLRTYADVAWNAPFYATSGFVESEPADAFHRELVEVERDLGLMAYGRRIQMTAEL